MIIQLKTTAVPMPQSVSREGAKTMKFKSKKEAENYLSENFATSTAGFCPYYSEEFLMIGEDVIPCINGNFENDWKNSEIDENFLYPDDTGGEIHTKVYLMENTKVETPYEIEDFYIDENCGNSYIIFKK